MDILASIGNTLGAITSGFWGKLGVLTAATATAFFTPIAGLITACFLLNIADLITGLEVAVKQGKTLWSRKTWTGTIKKIRQESVVIVLMHVIEHFAMSAITTTTVLSGGATVLICLTELWSILENLNTVNPKGPWRVLEAFLKHKGEEYSGLEIDIDKDGKVSEIKPVNVDVAEES